MGVYHYTTPSLLLVFSFISLSYESEAIGARSLPDPLSKIWASNSGPCASMLLVLPPQPQKILYVRVGKTSGIHAYGPEFDAHVFETRWWPHSSCTDTLLFVRKRDERENSIKLNCAMHPLPIYT